MNCLQAEEHFSAHFEDTLDYQTLQGFEEHLAACEACQHEYTRFQESVKAVQQLPQIEPSPYFMSTLQQRLATEQREPSSVKESVATGWGQVVRCPPPSKMGVQRYHGIDPRRSWNLFLPRWFLIQSRPPFNTSSSTYVSKSAGSNVA